MVQKWFPISGRFFYNDAKAKRWSCINKSILSILSAGLAAIEWSINSIKRNGTDAEIEVFEGLPHGLGLGTGTVAEGWIDWAVVFWEGQAN